jgi:hypothetical protein
MKKQGCANTKWRVSEKGKPAISRKPKENVKTTKNQPSLGVALPFHR